MPPFGLGEVVAGAHAQPNAVQIGLTATPRQIRMRQRTRESEQDERVTADNLKYFGEPVYEYDMAQAMEDGYLAVCEIVKGRVNLDQTGITLEEIMARHPRDAITGRVLSLGRIAGAV